MATKKNPSTAGLQPLKIGSRVRRSNDRVEGRIVWANGVSVKIRWDDGEQTAWRRDSLAHRPVEILVGEEALPESPTAPEMAANQAQATEPAPEVPMPHEPTAEQPDTLAVRQPRTREPKKAADDINEKKLSAIDDAAKVLAKTRHAHELQRVDRHDGGQGVLDLAWRQDVGGIPIMTVLLLSLGVPFAIFSV